MQCIRVDTGEVASLERLAREGVATAMSLAPAGAGGRPRRALIVEFWHIKCTRCPAALIRMNERARRVAGALRAPLFVACALATSGDVAAELAAVRRVLWEDACGAGCEACGEDEAGAGPPPTTLPHLTHVFMDWAQKEEAKKQFRFASVPHCVIFDAYGAQTFSGPPSDPMAERMMAELGA